MLGTVNLQQKKSGNIVSITVLFVKSAMNPVVIKISLKIYAYARGLG